MTSSTLDIARVKKYLKANNINIDNKYYGEYFRVTDELTLSFWVFDSLPQPSILQLRLDYPDAEIKADIALAQLRARRNKLLANTDVLVTADFPLSQEQKNNIMAYRQVLRDLPETIDPALLTLDEYGKFDKTLIPTLSY